MATETVLNNPYVNIQNEELDIHYGGKKIKVALEKVVKMYLTKKKSKYLLGFPGISLFMPDDSYNLHIKTNDNEIKIRVKNFDRQYFIGAISSFRNLTKRRNLA